MKALLKSPYTCDEGGGKLRIFQLGNDDNRYHEQAWFTDPIKAGKAVWSEPYFDMKMSGIAHRTEKPTRKPTLCYNIPN